MKTILILITLTLVLAGPFETLAENPSPIAIVGVTVVDVEKGALLEGQTVLLRDALIKSVQPSAQELPAGVTVVNGRGKYLIPGLFDSHVHFVDPPSYGKLFLAHGVTHVRDLGGSTGQVLAIRDALNKGEMTGPSMIATGAIVDGKPAIWPFSEECDTQEQGRAAVRKLSGQGVDQIKVYSMLKKDVYLAILDECKKIGIRAVGHIPHTVTLEEAVAAGQKTSEHLNGLDELLGRLSGSKKPGSHSNHMDHFRYWKEINNIDLEGFRSVLGDVAEAGMAHCPTLVVFQGLASLADGTGKEHPELAYVPGSIQSFWDPERYGFATYINDTIPSMKKSVFELHKAGVTLLAGSDLANPYVFAGASLHDELALLQDCGVPAAEVLRSATLNPSRVFGLPDVGTIKPGKIASLVLIRKNPLLDIRNAREIEAVFLRGRYIPADEIEELRQETLAMVKGVSKPGSSGEVDLNLPGTLIHRGTYTSTFNGMNAGSEDFAITLLADGGRRLKAHNQPIGFGNPSVTTAELAKNAPHPTIRWNEMTSSTVVKYEISGELARATALIRGQVLPPQTADIKKSAYFSGPSSAQNFAVFEHLELQVGKTLPFSSIGFGFPSWRMMVAPATLTRGEDEALTLPDGQSVNARTFRVKFNTPMGEFDTRFWAAEDGLPLKSIMKMSFGTVEVKLSKLSSGERG